MRSNPQCAMAYCPDENEIMAMTMGLLSEEEVSRIEGVLDRCAFCSELVAALAEDLEPAGEGGKQLTRVGKYEIEALLGVGGMGMIYKAMDRELQRPVALKLLRPDVVEPARRKAHTDRLLREAQLLASLRHENIPVVYEVGTWHEQVFLAIQLIDGANMRQWLEQASASWPTLVEMFCKAGDGIVAAHQADIIHRDIKPDNIMVSQDGEVWITDFGLARWVQSSYHTTSVVGAIDPFVQSMALTGEGALLGTPAYMAPEQYKGQGVSRRSDQFSFCVAVYEALYGMRPFEGQSMDELAEAAQRGEVFVPYRSGVPREVFQVLVRGMHPLPRERYSSMTALLMALRESSLRAQRGPSPHFFRRFATGLGLLAFGVGSFWLGRWTAPPVTKPRPNPALGLVTNPPIPTRAIPPQSKGLAKGTKGAGNLFGKGGLNTNTNDQAFGKGGKGFGKGFSKGGKGFGKGGKGFPGLQPVTNRPVIPTIRVRGGTSKQGFSGKRRRNRRSRLQEDLTNALPNGKLLQGAGGTSRNTLPGTGKQLAPPPTRRVAPKKRKIQQRKRGRGKNLRKRRPSFRK